MYEATRPTMSGSNPFDEIESWIDQITEEIETADVGSLVGGQVPVDVLDTGEQYEVRVDLPGYKRGDIAVTFADGTLTITAERDREAATEEAGRYVRRERRHDRTSRSVRLPEPVDEGETSATYDRGVLTVILPKAGTGEAGHEIDIE